MITRKQYLNKEFTHREYYEQFVTEHTKALVSNLSSNEELSAWDGLPLLSRTTGDLLRSCGDFPTKAGAVCIYKESHKQL